MMVENSIISEIDPESLRRAAQNRASVWIASGVLLVGIVVLGLAMGMGWIAVPDPSEKVWYGVWKLAVVIVPSALAMICFTLLERHQSTALHRTNLLLWIITAALYVAIVQPLLQQVFRLEQWAFMTWWTEIIADFLIVAPLEILLIYAIVRYGIFPSGLLQRQVDGFLFSAIVAMSIAIVIGIIHWQDPAYNPVWMSVHALGYFVLGGWMGYFLGVVRFRHTHLLYLAGGFFLAVILHTLETTYSAIVQTLTPWIPAYTNIFVGGTFAIVNLGILAWLIHRRNQELIQAAERWTKLITYQEAEHPQALLTDLVPMAQAIRPQPAVPPVTRPSDTREEEEDLDELTRLKRSWEALIAEQEASEEGS